MRRLVMLLLVVVVALAGCGTGEDDSTAEDSSVQDTPTGATTPPGDSTPSSPATLADTEWALTAIIDNGAATSAPRGTTATLSFDESGNIGVNDGCNTGGGEVEMAGSSFTVGNLISTQMACSDSARRTTQAAYDKVLKGQVEFLVDGDTLTLTKGEAGLEFTAR